MSLMNDGVKRIAYGYTRVSTEEQTFGASLENQRLAIQKYANQNNIEIVGWYTDAGISAKTAHRPQLQKMLTDIAKHKGRIDHVVVYNVSRISRDMTSFFNDIGFIMAKCGVTLRSTQEVIDESPTGRFMLNIALSVHQLDNDIKSKTVKDDMSLLAGYGWWMTQAPIGLKLKPIITGEYTNDGKKKHHNTLEIDDTNDIGKKIQFLLNRFSEGDIGPADLTKLAVNMGVNGKNGKPIVLNTMLGILRQSAYAGYNTSKRMLEGKPTKIKDFDGLIDIETFNKNQRILSGKHCALVPGNNELYPLRKLIICPKCGKLIRSSAPRNGSGKASPRYHYTTKGHGSIPIGEMHQLFVDFLEEITPNEGVIRLFKEIIKRTAAKKLGDTTRDLARHREAVSDIDKKLVEAVDAMLEGKIDLEEKNRYSEALERKRLDLRREIDNLERNQGLSEATIDYVLNFVSPPVKLWKDADLEAKQAYQQILFPNGLHFDIKDKIFGTDDLSPLFSVISTKKEPSSGSNSGMVIPEGVEPSIFWMRTRRPGPLDDGTNTVILSDGSFFCKSIKHGIIYVTFSGINRYESGSNTE